MEEQPNKLVKKNPFIRLLKLIVWLATAFVLFCLIGITLVFIYEDKVKSLLITELNKNLKSEIKVQPENIDLTFISSFPKCALLFKDVVVMESWNKKNRDTLAQIGSIGLRFSLKDLFYKKYNISEIQIMHAEINLKTDGKGTHNFEIWKSNAENNNSVNDSLNFKLEKISIQNSSINYRNKKELLMSEFVIHEIHFKGNFHEEEFELQTQGELQKASLQKDKLSYFQNKNIKLEINLEVKKNEYQFKSALVQLNQMIFDLNGDFKYSDSLESLDLRYQAKNLDVSAILSLLPEKYKQRINEYKSDGEFYAGGKIKYATNEPLMMQSDFGVKNSSILYKPTGVSLTNIQLQGTFFMDKTKSGLTLKNIHALLEGDKIQGEFALNDFNNPHLNLKADGELNLNKLMKFWPIDTLEKLEGKLNFKASVSGKLENLKEKTLSENVNINIDAGLNQILIQFKNDQKESKIESCRVVLIERSATVENLVLKRGGSDLTINGKIPGLFNFILNSKQNLNIIGELKSNNFHAEDFIYSSGQSSEINIPENLNLKLNVLVNELQFKEFKAQNISGEFELKNQKIMISDMNFETMDGKAEIDALADGSNQNLSVNMQANLQNINIQKLFSQLNNFGQATLTDKQVKGFANAQIHCSAKWDNHLNVDLNSIRSTVTLNINQGELNDFKPLEGLSKYVDVEDLKRIKFSTLSSTISIQNKIIYIPQTTVKNTALNIELNGTHDFDNNINYHIRLLISELLSKKRKGSDDEFGPVENDPENRRSAFIQMSGNIDDIHYKYDKQGLKQKIKEDIQLEKQNLKQILKEEFGLFKNDTLKPKEKNKADQKFELEQPNNKKKEKPLEPKKKDDDDDDF
ncbi:MAG: AsmA family protein [Sphingobacteriaceae bacterium]|nr:AsmA family protein [Sphingobacteriaceae bacterium]